MNILNYTLRFAAAVSIVTAVESWAGDSDTKANTNFSVLSGVQNRDLPGKAAELVAAADALHQPLVTSQVVKAALQVNPGSAALVVGSIARTVPAMAANAALAAVTVKPSEVTIVARAAALAAPQKAGEITKVLCRAMPSSYRAIAETVASVVPNSVREVLAAVGDAIPSLKATIAQVEAQSEMGNLTVYAVLAQIGEYVSTPISTSSSGYRAYSTGSAGTPPPAPVPTIPPASGTPVPVGGQTDLPL